MSRILTSLHGRELGLGNDRDLISLRGFTAGAHGKQVSSPGPSKVALFDDFLGDVLADEWNYVEGTDTATAGGAVLAGGIGGTLQLTTGDTGSIAGDAAQITSFLNWQASNGGLAMQARIKPSRITAAYLFVGFTDVITLEAPVISASSADTVTTNASDAVGFMFDTNMATDNWWLVGVAADTDATAQNSGVAPVAADYTTLRVEVTPAGVATFFINGVQVGTAMAGALTAATDLTPTILAATLSGTASLTLDVDYVHVAMNRAADGDAT
jgi:hypothetical protein